MQISFCRKIVALSYLFLSPSLQAVIVQLPDEVVLAERIEEVMGLHFIKKTDLIQQLAGKRREAISIALAVEVTLHDYVEHYRTPTVTTIVHVSKNLLLKALLSDSPEAMEELRTAGLLK